MTVVVTLRPLYHREKFPVHIEVEARWALELVWMCVEMRKSLAPTGI
jgi:hypothetical protein